MRNPVDAALTGDRLAAPPYLFNDQPCTLTQLRVLLADAAGCEAMPRMLMDDKAIWLRDDDAGRSIMFTRSINADGISVVNPNWTEARS